MAKSAILGFFAFASLLACDLRADVFSLWSFGRSGSGWPGSAAAETLNPTKLWIEPVVVNGNELSMGISLVENSFEGCVFQLRSAYPKASYAANSDSILMETKLDDGRRLRVFLVSMPGISTVMQFSMELPGTLPSKPQWPANMPLPASSTPLTVMQFPKRGSSYGLFSSALSPEQALGEMRKSLVSSGWRPAGGDSGASENGSEIYLRERPLEIAIVGASEGEDGKTRGSVYTRALPK